MSGVVGFAEAMAVVLDHAAGVHATAVETVGLLAAAGRVLAADVVADRDQPGFDRATRDGFAVRAEEFAAGMKLRVAGTIRAGEGWASGEVGAGCAVEIMTGAAVPAGVDAVAMVEHVEQGGGEVWAAAGRGLRVEENVVRRGREARAGGVVVRAGSRVGGAEIAEAASCGCVSLKVFGRPKVAIVATGDELVEVEETPGEWQIRNSNSYALAALVGEAGGEAVRLGIARDTRDDVRAKILAARGCGLLLLSGGVSAGKYDLVEEVLAELGAEFLFTGVRMQPGKPVVFGRLRWSEVEERNTEILSRSAAQNDEGEGWGGREGRSGWTYFFGLPGNPVSTEVTFRCFVGTMVRALGGEGVVGPRFVQATLGEDCVGKVGLTRLLPARIVGDLDKVEVRLVGWQGSGDLAANARANCYLVLGDGRDLTAGDVVSVLLR